MSDVQTTASQAMNPTLGRLGLLVPLLHDGRRRMRAEKEERKDQSTIVPLQGGPVFEEATEELTMKAKMKAQQVNKGVLLEASRECGW